uniref:NADH-ubiquinone oxidoreductase chain 2 n=1 Tax=Perissonemia borneenis TaxID=1964418 RepID=A0A343BT78_9HEMI|nr:NADH dehydrogenase subunit 2 [Perissonemia borneenis]
MQQKKIISNINSYFNNYSNKFNKMIIHWMAMEINMMMTIPFIYQNMNKESSEKIMIYFLTQTMSSSLMLLMILTEYKMTTSFNMMMTMSMMIKLGVPPFHMWMPEMLNKLNWDLMIIMITLQKINPLMVMSQLMEKNMLFPMIMILTSSIGSISGINQLSLNKIMAFSSINHMSWIMMCMLTNNNLWMNYFFIYSIITTTLCMMFNKKMIYFINQTNINLNLKSKIMLFMMMLNLGGLPPMPGFFLKWMVIETMSSLMNMYFTMIIMLMCSMITLLFYMRMMYNNMMFSTMNIKFMMINYNKYSYLMFMTNLLLPMLMMI